MQARVAQADRQMNADHFFFEFVSNKFGRDATGRRHCEVLLVSFEKHKDADSRVNLFRRFLGLDRDKLPYAVFQQYVQLIKATNFNVQSLFTKNIQNLYIELSQAKQHILSLIPDALPYLQTQVHAQAQQFAKVFSDNKRLAQGVDAGDYKLFKDLADKLAHAKLKADPLAPLFVHGPTTSLQALADLLAKTFDFQLPDAKQRLLGVLKTFVLEALDVAAHSVTKDAVVSALRQRFELKLPVAAFLHVGLNAAIEHQNIENAWLEGVYQFYAAIEVDPVQIELGQALRKPQMIAGLEFEQFLFFLQDADTKLAYQQALTVYKITCEQNYRVFLACDDFIEACCKFRLVPSKKTLEDNRRQREAKLARGGSDNGSNRLASTLSRGSLVEEQNLLLRK